MMRVAKRGYLEVPSLMGEYLAPKASHTWVSLEKDGKILVCNKKELGMHKPTMDAGDLFLYHLPKNSLAYKTLMHTHGNLLTLRYEWDNEINFEVNPDFKSLPITPDGRWLPEMIRETFPEKSVDKEIIGFTKALFEVGKSYALNRLNGKPNKRVDEKIGLGIQVAKLS